MIRKMTGNRKGFSMVELLCTIVVLLLLSGLVAVGVRLAAGSMRTLVMDSEAQTLCATIRSIVSDELRYSGSIQKKGNQISFFSQNYAGIVAFSVNEDGQILLGDNKLLSKKSYPYDMRAEVDLTGYDSDSRIFDVTVSVTDAEGKVLSDSQFQVKQLNEPALIEEE